MAGFDKDFLQSFIGMRRQMERLLNDVFRPGRPSSFAGEHSFSPPADVFETDKGFTVKVELAGVAKDDIEVTFSDGHLTISGRRQDHSPEARLSCQQMEIAYGHFKRGIFVSTDVDGDRIAADYVDGFLVITLPRARLRQHRKIQIKVE